jgi:hypothetical protein
MSSASAGGSALGSGPRFEIDTKYGGVYAGTSFEFSADVAAHYNEAARAASGVLPGEFLPFEPGLYCSIACPSTGLPREQFIQAYHQLRVRLDSERELRLGEFPRLFSAHPRDAGILRGVPTYIPKTQFPDDFFGQAHTLELFQGAVSIFGPVQRFFHTTTSGSIFQQLEDGPGRLVVEIVGDLSILERVGQVVFFTDPAFGEPTGAAQLFDDGSSAALQYDLLGKDHVGDTMLFNEGVVVDVKPRGPRAVVELYFPHKGTGLAGALFSGHTRDLAYRARATVF